MQTYNTKNSTYEIDMENRRYRRFPRDIEGAVRSEDSERLTYNEWHTLHRMNEPVKVINMGSHKVLHIMEETSTAGILTAPLDES